MDIKTIKGMCSEKREALLAKYYGNIIHEAVHDMPETIDEGKYSLEMPAKVELEYRVFLENLLQDIDPEKNINVILDKHHLSTTFTEDDREQLEEAYKDAKLITIWERITKSNHEDVTHYKGLLKAYTEELLKWMEIDFMEDIVSK